MTGRLIVIEGGDAAGKQTHTRLLAAKLGAARFAFPDYETPAGRVILSFLKEELLCVSGDGEIPPTVNAMVLQALMLTNRMERVADICDTLRHGDVVLDRYSASAQVYGALDGLEPDWLETIQTMLPPPDLWLLIDLPIDEGFKRRPERRDRYEKNRDLMQQVRESYLALWSRMSLEEPGRWKVIDGMGTKEEVADRIWQAALP